MMMAVAERDLPRPGAVRLPFQRQGVRVPIVEIAHQRHLFGVGRHADKVDRLDCFFDRVMGSRTARDENANEALTYFKINAGELKANARATIKPEDSFCFCFPSGLLLRLAMSENFSDAALVLVGHGSTVNADSAAPTCQHADELRRRNLFAQVQEAFWKQEPYLARSCAAFSRRVCSSCRSSSATAISPRKSSRANWDFAAKAKRILRACNNAAAKRSITAGPVGTHPGMTEVLLARAREIVEKFPFPRAPKPADTALFIAGHGTGNNENSRKAIEQQVELIRAKTSLRGSPRRLHGGRAAHRRLLQTRRSRRIS